MNITSLFIRKIPCLLAAAASVSLSACATSHSFRQKSSSKSGMVEVEEKHTRAPAPGLFAGALSGIVTVHIGGALVERGGYPVGHRDYGLQLPPPHGGNCGPRMQNYSGRNCSLPPRGGNSDLRMQYNRGPNPRMQVYDPRMQYTNRRQDPRLQYSQRLQEPPYLGSALNPIRMAGGSAFSDYNPGGFAEFDPRRQQQRSQQQGDPRRQRR